MSYLEANLVSPSSSLLTTARWASLFNGQTRHAGLPPARVSVQFQPFHVKKQYILAAAHPRGVGSPSSQSICERILIRKLRPAVLTAAAMNVECRASGQTQTVTRDAPTITQFPLHGNVMSPELDDGGSGFPPRDDSGGGGGGGGEGKFSGGFFLFGALAVLSLLKDMEMEQLSKR